MEQNASTAPASHDQNLNDLQKMSCQVIAQAISLALSIRELIRQGYLFGGHVLVRAFVERVTILLYLHECPEKVGLWNNGWTHKEAPSLAKMFEVIQQKQQHTQYVRGFELTSSMNSLTHGKPSSARWNTVPINGNSIGHSVSKILNRPELCDELCADIIPWMVSLQGMIAAYFPPRLDGAPDPPAT